MHPAVDRAFGGARPPGEPVVHHLEVLHATGALLRDAVRRADHRAHPGATVHIAGRVHGGPAVCTVVGRGSIAPVRVTPISVDALVDEVTELVAGRPGRVRVAIDGPPPTAPDALAQPVATGLRALGRAVVVVAATDFLRPASVRLEYGHHDPDELLDGWLDEAALRREVLGPAAPDGSGRVLPRLWDPGTDRAYRDGYVALPDNGVVVLAGALLLGRGLPFDLAVHLRMTPAALARTLPVELAWTLPAYARYDSENAPADAADLLVLADHPDRPAVRR